jgi:hypothetical protein
VSDLGKVFFWKEGFYHATDRGEDKLTEDGKIGRENCKARTRDVL